MFEGSNVLLLSAFAIQQKSSREQEIYTRVKQRSPLGPYIPNRVVSD